MWARQIRASKTKSIFWSRVGEVNYFIDHRWVVGHEGHPEGLQLSRVADPGQHQQLRRVEGAGAQDDLGEVG